MEGRLGEWEPEPRLKSGSPDGVMLMGIRDKRTGKPDVD
jgi:hypothetical protein